MLEEISFKTAQGRLEVVFGSHISYQSQTVDSPSFEIEWEDLGNRNGEWTTCKIWKECSVSLERLEGMIGRYDRCFSSFALPNLEQMGSL